MALRLKLLRKFLPKDQMFFTPSQTIAVREGVNQDSEITGSIVRSIEVECELVTKEEDGYTYAELKDHRGWFVIQHGEKKYGTIRESLIGE